jgi:hypothetical protein
MKASDFVTEISLMMEEYGDIEIFVEKTEGDSTWVESPAINYCEDKKKKYAEKPFFAIN